MAASFRKSRKESQVHPTRGKGPRERRLALYLPPFPFFPPFAVLSSLPIQPAQCTHSAGECLAARDSLNVALSRPRVSARINQDASQTRTGRFPRTAHVAHGS